MLPCCFGGLAICMHYEKNHNRTTTQDMHSILQIYIDEMLLKTTQHTNSASARVQVFQQRRSFTRVLTDDRRKKRNSRRIIHATNAYRGLQ